MDSDIKTNGMKSEVTMESIQTRLNESRTLESIDKLLDRIDSLEKAVENLTMLMERGPGLAAMTVDVVDEEISKANERGVKIEERLGNLIHLAERLTENSTVEKIDQLIKLSEQSPGLVAMTMDMVDEEYANAREEGINIEERLQIALRLAERFTDPKTVEKINGMLTLSDQAPGLMAMFMDSLDEEMSKPNNRKLIDLVGKAAEAFSETQSHPIERISGFFSMLRALKDPDRQKAIGFLMSFTKKIGQKL